MAERKPAIVVSLLTLVIFQGLSGLAGGFGLINDPTGETLQIPIEWLKGSPFNDYLIAGIILFVVLGIFPLIISFGLWKRKDWGRLWSIALGAALIIWILVEILVIGWQTEPPLQLIYGVVGIAILLLSLSPQVKRFYSLGH